MCRVIEEALRVRLRKGVSFNCEKKRKGRKRANRVASPAAKGRGHTGTLEGLACG